MAVNVLVPEVRLLSAAAEPHHWLLHGRDYRETRFSPLRAIDASNVPNLALAWHHDLGFEGPIEATALEADGVIYTTGSWSIVFAIEARTGSLLWKWDPNVDQRYRRVACCGPVNRGLAIYEDRVYVGVLDGRLASLAARDGRLLWETATVDQNEPYTITGAPRVVKGNVVIGNAGADYGVRGYVSAYDAQTGSRAWRFYTVPGPPNQEHQHTTVEEVARTWTGEWWKYGGGGTVWDAITYDPELDLVYVGTGNGSPWNRQIRSPGGGDNLFLSSILALRPNDGTLVWYYQTTPGDSWDFGATQHMLLVDIRLGQETRKVLMQASKNGFFYLLDRATGELLSADAFVPVTWATHVDELTGRPVEVDGARYTTRAVAIMPGPYGGHSWPPMSYNPQTGLVYFSAQVRWGSYAQPENFRFRPGSLNSGVSMGAVDVPSAPPVGRLIAWDPVARAPRWSLEEMDVQFGGTLSTAGGLLFSGTSDGRLLALDAQTGAKLWEAVIGGVVLAPPITYELDGVQYISVTAGSAGSYGAPPRAGIGMLGRILTFALPDQAHSPTNPELPAELRSENATGASADERTAGAEYFSRWCSVCHGHRAAGDAELRDLRIGRSGTFTDFRAVVVGGGMMGSGMPSFAPWLGQAEVEAIWAYLTQNGTPSR